MLSVLAMWFVGLNINMVFGIETTHIDYKLLLNHERLTPINIEERREIKRLFDGYDMDYNDCLNELEFGRYIRSETHSEEQFILMDINHDGVLSYRELVHMLRQLIVIPQLRSTDIKIDLREIFGDLYDENDNNNYAEYLAMTLFEIIDPFKENIIRKNEYIEFQIDLEFAEYDKHGDDKCITFPEFKLQFFHSPTFNSLQRIHKQRENNEFDIGQLVNNIISTLESDILAIKPIYGPHQLPIHDERRRLNIFTLGHDIYLYSMGNIIGGNIYTTIAYTTGDWGTNDGSHPADGCYSDNGLINILNNKGIKEIKQIKDITVGDYVFDGNKYSKIYYIHSESHNKRIEMNKIKYGDHDNSLTLTGDHLVYMMGFKYPIISDDISIGDVLQLAIDDDMNGINGTVYDIEIVYGYPLIPVTESGNLMVNGIKTSCFTKSVEKQNQLHRSGMIFRWISNNINQHLAVIMIDFYFDGIYRSFMNDTAKNIFLNNTISALLFIISFPLLAIYCTTKMSTLLVYKK
eukprot:956805_1